MLVEVFCFYSIQRLFLLVYFLLGQSKGISQHSSFTVILPSKIEALCLASRKVSALFEALLEAFSFPGFLDFKK